MILSNLIRLGLHVDLSLILIFIGQFAHALLRTSAVRVTAEGRQKLTVSLNLAANLVRLLVLTGSIDSVMRGSWVGVAVFLCGQAAGDFLSMRVGAKP